MGYELTNPFFAITCEIVKLAKYILVCNIILIYDFVYEHHTYLRYDQSINLLVKIYSLVSKYPNLTILQVIYLLVTFCLLGVKMLLNSKTQKFYTTRYRPYTSFPTVAVLLESKSGPDQKTQTKNENVQQSNNNCVFSKLSRIGKYQRVCLFTFSTSRGWG